MQALHTVQSSLQQSSTNKDQDNREEIDEMTDKNKLKGIKKVLGGEEEEEDDEIDTWNDNDGGFYKPPPDISYSQLYKNFIYNPNTGQVMGRTGSSWVKICTFYLIFYLVLSSVFGIMMWTFYHTLDQQTPRWQLTESLIGQYPGLGFRPMPNDSDTKSTLIWYQGKSKTTYDLWTESLESYLEVYRMNAASMNATRGKNIHNCDYDKLPGDGQVCEVDVKNWFPCTAENHFNYHQSGPCVFIKLNKIFGWIPDYYSDADELPDNMPEELKLHIGTLKETDPQKLKTVWVSCEGESPIDKENIGEMEYIPRQGFPGYFYPYINTEGYLSPLVAVHFKRPKTGVIINIECRTWAKNLIQDRKERIGIVHFELLID